MYGCYFSYKIKESFPNCEVVLHEKNSGIMLEASTNNQHRLHLGYHYPRSEKTIEEVIRNAKKFEQEFKDCLTVLDNNFYLIHKNSLVDFEQYVRVYDKFELEHKVVAKEKIKSYLTDVENIEGVLDTKEKCIDNHKVRNVIEKRMKMSGVKIVLNTEVDIKDVAPHADLVINTTYTNPNMGLDHMMSSSESLDKWIMSKDAAKVNSIAKSLSETASSEFSQTPSNFSFLATLFLSMG